MYICSECCFPIVENKFDVGISIERNINKRIMDKNGVLIYISLERSSPICLRNKGSHVVLITNIIPHQIRKLILIF